MTYEKGIFHRAENLVRLAEQYGIVLTVAQQPLQPLAMGNYVTTVATRPARHPAPDRDARPQPSELWDKVTAILDGIDRTELDNDGWWPTSTGADFGRGLLLELMRVIDPAPSRLSELELDLEVARDKNRRLELELAKVKQEACK